MWVRVCAIVASLFGRPGRVGGGGGEKILREKVCPLLGGQRRRPFDAGEETLGQLVKMRVVPDAQRIGHDDTPSDLAPFEAESRVDFGKRGDAPLQRDRDIGERHDVKLRPPVLARPVARQVSVWVSPPPAGSSQSHAMSSPTWMPRTR